MVVEKMIDLMFRAFDAFDAARDRLKTKVSAKPAVNYRSATATSSTSTVPSKAEKAPKINAKKTVKKKSEKQAVVKTRSVAMPKTTTKVGKQKLKTLENVTVTKTLDSARSGKKIHSDRADQIWQRIKKQDLKVVSESAEVSGKKSLAWVMWALGTADESQLRDGISVHDVSALLYHAAKIEIYPINVSRMVHDHTDYIQQTSQEKRTKRYLLTDEGRKLVTQLPLTERQG